jgi:hypothetical protein
MVILSKGPAVCFSHPHCHPGATKGSEPHLTRRRRNRPDGQSRPCGQHRGTLLARGNVLP